ncbi:MAG: hypothetical protein VX736_03970 [Candidatus Neomarinimicrobiota bacterium]|nr:hypothetical protein [Candidatus Neomarinimicrobiota bacterium]
MSSIIILLIFSDLLFGQTKKEQIFIDFLDARYAGNADSAKMYLDPNFVYNHVPYVGLGISTYMDNGHLKISSVSPFGPARSLISKDDIILEVNGIKASEENVRSGMLNFLGAENDTINIVLESSLNQFNSIDLTLAQNQFKQGVDSFLNDIRNYNDRWYEYDIELLDYFSKKNNVVLYYHWEGVLTEGGPTYHWRAMEIIKMNPKGRKIVSIDAIWSEKQFRDQFK